MEFAEDLTREEQVTRLAFIQKHVVNGRVSLAPEATPKPETSAEDSADVPEGGKPGETDGDKRKGKSAKLGDAVASSYQSYLYPAMVSFVQDPGIHLVKADPIRVPDFMPAGLLFADLELDQFKKTLPLVQPLVQSPPTLYRDEASLPTEREVRPQFEACVEQVKNRDLLPEYELLKTLINEPSEEIVKDVYEELRDNKSHRPGRPAHRRSSSVPDFNRAPAVNMPAKEALTKDLKKTAQQHLIDFWKRTGGPPKPSTADILRAHALLARQYPKLQTISQRNKVRIRDHLRFEYKWDVSLDRVAQVLCRKFVCTSFGELPGTVPDVVKADLEAEHQARLRTLPKGRQDKQRQEREQTKAQEKESVKELRQRMKMNYKPVTVHDIVDKPLEPHNEDTKVRLRLVRDPNLKSYLRLVFDFNYIRKGAAAQPRHVASVTLNEKNARSDQPGTDGLVTEYLGYHQVVDADGEEWDEPLQRLFPHVQEGYFAAQRKADISEHRRFLIAVPHNDAAYTSNVFCTTPDMPKDHDKLQRCMREPGSRIYVLVRAFGDFANQLNALVEDFNVQTSYNPLNAFFLDENQRIIGPKTVKPLLQRPQMQAPCEFSFDTWEDYRLRAGLGAFIELDWRDTAVEHKGNAIFYPVPRSDNAIYGPMAYFAVVKLTHLSDTKDAPSLTPGTHVQLMLGQDHVLRDESYWNGQVIPRTPMSSTGTVTLLIFRRRIEGTTYVEGSLSKYTSKQIAASDAYLLRRDAKNHQTKVTIYPGSDHREMSRQMKALSNFHVSTRVEAQRPIYATIMDGHRKLLMCNDPQGLPQSSLWAGVTDAFRDRARQEVYDNLQEHQSIVVQGWEDNGLRDNTAAISGNSGSGKSTLADFAVLPFLTEVNISGPVATQVEYERLMQAVGTQKAEQQMEQRIAKELAAEAQAAEGLPRSSDDVDEDIPEPDDDKNEDVADDDGETRPRGKGKKEKAPLPDIPEIDAVVEKGRVLCIAAQNETVNQKHEKFLKRAREFREKMELPPPLAIRLHSIQTEQKAILAMTNPLYEEGPEIPSLLNHEEILDGTVNVDLLNVFMTQAGGSHFRNIRDKRFVKEEASAARYACELGGIRELSPELKAVFTDEELQQALKDCDLTEAMSLCVGNNGHNKESSRLVHTRGRRALNLLFRKATIITTTPSTAAESQLFLAYHPHAIIVEEASRLTDGQIWVLFSQYWTAQFRLLVGDWRQLGPMQFCPEKLNAFAAQGYVSLLYRLKLTGFHVPELLRTRRFGNQDLLMACRIANDMPHIEMDALAPRPEDTATLQKYNGNRHGVKEALVMINVRDCAPFKDTHGSWCCRETAIAVMNDVRKFLTDATYKDKGDKITILTPYRGQLDTLEQMRADMIQDAKNAGFHGLVDELTDMIISTVDSYMGEENDYVFLDTVGHLGFLTARNRFVVALTRGRLGVNLYGALLQMSQSKLPDTHPIMRFLRHFKRNIHDLTKGQFAAMHQFPRVFTECNENPSIDRQPGAGQDFTRTEILDNPPANHVAETDDDDQDMAQIMRDAGMEPTATSSSKPQDDWTNGNSWDSVDPDGAAFHTGNTGFGQDNWNTGGVSDTGLGADDTGFDHDTGFGQGAEGDGHDGDTERPKHQAYVSDADDDDDVSYHEDEASDHGDGVSDHDVDISEYENDTSDHDADASDHEEDAVDGAHNRSSNLEASPEKKVIEDIKPPETTTWTARLWNYIAPPKVIVVPNREADDEHPNDDDDIRDIDEQPESSVASGYPESIDSIVHKLEDEQDEDGLTQDRQEDATVNPELWKFDADGDCDDGHSQGQPDIIW